ncbi:MAG: hypothetical protein AB7G06_04645 [Bdellovibrionales bacterium]
MLLPGEKEELLDQWCREKGLSPAEAAELFDIALEEMLQQGEEAADRPFHVVEPNWPFKGL